MNSKTLHQNSPRLSTHPLFLVHLKYRTVNYRALLFFCSKEAYNNGYVFMHFFPVSEPFIVRITQHPEDILKAQRLRYDVYYTETMRSNSEELDVDPFDAFCEHLIVEETSTGKIVGTYRLISSEAARSCGQFYSQSEFNLEHLLQSNARILELGRACVHANYRTQGVIRLLWKGLLYYTKRNRIKYLFGCASFPGLDASIYQHGFSYLHYARTAPEHICPKVLPKNALKVSIFPPEEVHITRAWSEIPSLLRAYLQVGGWVGQGVFQDDEFRCFDMCVVVDVERLILGDYGLRLVT